MTVATETRVAELVKPYTGKHSKLIEALHRVQSELGYIPKDAQAVVAQALNVPLSQVWGAITFYNFFRTTPPGKHTVRVCLGTACHVRGAEGILKAICKELDVAPGKTTADGEFTVEGVRCVGACGLAPLMVVDDEVYGRLDVTRTKRLLRKIGKDKG